MADRDLLPDLWGTVVDHDELVDAIIKHFGMAQQDADGSIVCPGRGIVGLRIEAAQDRIGAIRTGPAFDEQAFHQLRETVRTSLLESPGDTVQEHVFFASSPVEGTFRHSSGKMEILPAPPNAPRANVLLADHPFLLRFSIRGSSDWQVTGLRAAREAMRWAWVLNAVLRHHVHAMKPSAEHHWVLCEPEGDGPIEGRVRWAQEFYSFGPPESGDAAPSAYEPINVLPDRDYYSDLHPTVTDKFDLPQSFAALVDRYLALSTADKDRFLRAAQWVAAADELCAIHRGAWYVALSSAVETLAYDLVQPDPCPSCGHDRSQRPTKQFKAFLEAYATGPGHRSVIDRLYSVRSSLVHGLDGLRHDLPYQVTFKPAVLDERAELDRMSRMVRAALVNWLGSASARAAPQKD